MKTNFLIKMSALLLVLVCLSSAFALPVAAESGRVYDPTHMLTDTEAVNVGALLDELSAEYGVELYLATYVADDRYDDFYGDDYCTQVKNIKDENAVLLIVTYDCSDTTFYYNMYTYGDAHKKISDEEVDQILDRRDVFDNIKNGSIATGVEAFFVGSAVAYDDHVYDTASMLTLDEANALTDLLDELSAEAGVELYLATYVADDRYDDFYGDDYCTRVRNLKDADAVLLVVTYEEFNNTYYYNMYTYGQANYAINQKEVNYILDTYDVYYNLKGGNVYEGSVAFFETSATAFVGRLGTPIGVIVVISAIISILIAFAVRAAVVAVYKKKTASVDYPLDRYARLELTHEEDSFVREYTTRTYVPRSSGSSGGGRHGGGGGHRGGR